jgi:hypothetical protein
MSFQLHKNGQYIPCDLPTLREMARKGDLAQDEYVYDERIKQWVGAAQIAEMKDAWNIGENEATVAMELTPEMLAMFDGSQGGAAQVQAAAVKIEAPAPQPPAARPAPRVSEPAPRLVEPRHEAPVSRSASASRGSSRPAGKIDDPTMSTIKNVICFVFAILWIMRTFDEANNFWGEKRFTWWHLLIPVYGILVLWKFFKNVSEMAQAVGANVPDRAVIYLVGQMCTSGLLTFYLVQTDLNAIWQHMGAKRA